MSEHRPNIVFIITDQMRGDCMGHAGHPVVETPNLDHLAGDGVSFSNAYSSCPSCIGARASMFTGLTPSTHGRIGYRDGVPWRYQNTLAQLLSDGGYQTHLVGKHHFYPMRNHQGFHSMDSYEHSGPIKGYVNDYHDFLAKETGGRLSETDHGLWFNSWVARPSHLPEELHNNTWVVNRGLDFVRRRDKTRPFFLNLSFHRPHSPLDPPQAYWDMYRDRPLPDVPVGDWAGRYDKKPTDINAWFGHLPQEALDRARRAYYAQIAHIDNQIGRFMLAMGAQGPTWFIFTSDHGDMMGDHHHLRKGYAYEGSAGIPFIVRPPRPGAGGVVSNAPVLQEDILPTCMEIAGLPTPDGVEGRSLVPFTKEEGPGQWREFLHGEHSGVMAEELGMQFMTDGKEKYIWYTVTGEEQFFDLEADPQECHNRAGHAGSADRVTMWRQRMVDYLATRPQDGLSDGTKLIPGTNLPSVRPELL